MAFNISTTTAFQSVQATVSTTALDLDTFGFTAAEVSEASRCTIFVNTNAIRIDWSGNAPTVSSGASVTASLEIVGTENIKQIQLIRDDAVDAEVFIILEK